MKAEATEIWRFYVWLFSCFILLNFDRADFVPLQERNTPPFRTRVIYILLDLQLCLWKRDTTSSNAVVHTAELHTL
jgi:hypothetical protein